MRPNTNGGSHGARNFNPRTHEGCDNSDFFSFLYVLNFNPRTHEGCDTSTWDRADAKGNFNPRTHEGCDPFPSGYKQHIRKFKSTHPCRMRFKSLGALPYTLQISIHATMRDATTI